MLVDVISRGLPLDRLAGKTEEAAASCGSVSRSASRGGDGCGPHGPDERVRNCAPLPSGRGEEDTHKNKYTPVYEYECK